jgi:type I restriction enzyme S subunit
VARIEELFTKLDAGVTALKKVRAQLKRYRQAVLKYAFEGKLTEEWRENHKNELEPAAVILERIKEERKKTAKGKLKELPPPDTSDLTEIPEGWVWTRLGEIVTDVEKINLKIEPNKEFIYLDIASIDNCQQKITNPKKHIGKDAPSRARQLVKSGDILFSTVRTYLKNIAIINEIYDGQIASTGFCIIRPHSLLDNKMVFYWVQTEEFVNPLNKIQRGTSYPAVRDFDVFTQFIPLPPLAEQHKIVEEIERRFSIADEVEKIVEQSLKQAERLRMSILKRAFEGKLVLQNPNDEPAEKLLERIKYARDQKFKPIKSDEY